MLSWIPDLASFLQSLLICLGAFVLGFLIGHRVTPRQGITPLSILAFGMTATGLWLWFAWHAPKIDLSSNQAVLEAVGSILLLIPGFIIACFGCGVALATARRVGHKRSVVALVIASVLPLLATLAMWDYTIQVALHLYPGQPVVRSAQTLTFLIAPIGTVDLVVYGIYGQIAPRRGPTSQAI